MRIIKHVHTKKRGDKIYRNICSDSVPEKIEGARTRNPENYADFIWLSAIALMSEFIPKQIAPSHIENPI